MVQIPEAPSRSRKTMTTSAEQRFDKRTLLATIFASTLEADVARRQSLRSALRWWRSAVDPTLVDLPERRRRRQGLTREDVAELAGLSLCWYTLFETGSPKHRCSPRSVDRIANALQLSDEDRAVLQLLASPEAFHSIRLIVKRWIEWKPMRSEPRRRLRRVVENLPQFLLYAS
jgi:transcriptional regulator with XRE-family HTH domain